MNCVVLDCEQRIRSKNALYCEKHYMRWYRHGDPVVVAHKYESRRRDGYIVVRAQNHPLAHNDWVPEHRKILYDAIGDGAQGCFWCGRQLFWRHAERHHRLYVDHLNAKRDDNRLDNLVPSCAGCNFGRGGHGTGERNALFIAARRILERHKQEFDIERAAVKAQLNSGPTQPIDVKVEATALRSAAALVAGIPCRPQTI